MSSSGDILEEEHEGSVVDALSLLDDSPAGPSFGVGTPNDEESEFGTHEPDFGVSDDDEGLPIPPSAAGGGDLYEFGDESPDFGDEIPGVNEIYGDSPNGGFEHPPADVAFDLALLASQEPSEDDETAAAEAVAGDAADADYTIGAPLVPSRAYELERIAADHAAVATRKEKLEKTRDYDHSFAAVPLPRREDHRDRYRKPKRTRYTHHASRDRQQDPTPRRTQRLAYRVLRQQRIG